MEDAFEGDSSSADRSTSAAPAGALSASADQLHSSAPRDCGGCGPSCACPRADAANSSESASGKSRRGVLPACASRRRGPSGLTDSAALPDVSVSIDVCASMGPMSELSAAKGTGEAGGRASSAERRPPSTHAPAGPGARDRLAGVSPAVGFRAGDFSRSRRAGASMSGLGVAGGARRLSKRRLRAVAARATLAGSRTRSVHESLRWMCERLAARLGGEGVRGRPAAFGA